MTATRRLLMLEWWSKQTIGWQLTTSGTGRAIGRSAVVAGEGVQLLANTNMLFAGMVTDAEFGRPCMGGPSA